MSQSRPIVLLLVVFVQMVTKGWVGRRAHALGKEKLLR